ncbi:tetratricopeptide repeat containing protein [Pseudozyma hubeiensis SY62]|uniref:Tetratricopeptide repeat containing protein n=1 Tax=Pseudozyma hubeiensis (strain SY62) TaxID=1305764 RepID=R9P993_PSEHS|nr:tetratricopeptide repeat containing protein [Pseudozyma hubeiensis SY62]GAC97931.1 tetratricopeptide repeat containing protein [Pseudozyma hubeiensis SY62]
MYQELSRVHDPQRSMRCHQIRQIRSRPSYHQAVKVYNRSSIRRRRRSLSKSDRNNSAMTRVEVKQQQAAEKSLAVFMLRCCWRDEQDVTVDGGNQKRQHSRVEIIEVSCYVRCLSRQVRTSFDGRSELLSFETLVWLRTTRKTVTAPRGHGSAAENPEGDTPELKQTVSWQHF